MFLFMKSSKAAHKEISKVNFYEMILLDMCGSEHALVYEAEEPHATATICFLFNFPHASRSYFVLRISYTYIEIGERAAKKNQRLSSK